MLLFPLFCELLSRNSCPNSDQSLEANRARAKWFYCQMVLLRRSHRQE
jgi:hypothetical protein